MTDADVLRALGGPSRVAQELGLKVKTVGNWSARGIAWKWRRKVAALAVDAGVTVPGGFLDGRG